MSNGQNGKGDKPRPYSVDIETYKNNWERTFGRSYTTVDELDVETCAYSGLRSTHSYETKSIESARTEILDELTQLSQELGLYEDNKTPE
jgi:hypothetical protein